MGDYTCTPEGWDITTDSSGSTGCIHLGGDGGTAT